MAEDLTDPSCVRHVGPVIFVETGSALERALVRVEDKTLLVLVDAERAPRHCEQFVPHPENSTEGQYRVCHAASRNVDHELVDFAKVVSGGVSHVVAGQSARRKNAAIPFVGIGFLDLALLHGTAPSTAPELHLWFLSSTKRQ